MVSAPTQGERESGKCAYTLFRFSLSMRTGENRKNWTEGTSEDVLGNGCGGNIGSRGDEGRKQKQNRRKRRRMTKRETDVFA